ncbi:uncharacterized protein LOC144751357 [Ciona intestinalis]
MALYGYFLALLLLSVTVPHSIAFIDPSLPDNGFDSPTDIPAPPNGEVECKTEYGITTCSAKCKSGFTFASLGSVGDTLVNQWMDGEWTIGPKFPPCKRTLCEAKHPEKGKVRCETSGNKMICDVECNPGYRSEHTHYYMCDLDNGEWSPSLPKINRFPTCIIGEQSCINMEAPENGYIICETVDGIHKCTPMCKVGYGAVGMPMEGYFKCSLGMWLPSEKVMCLRKFTIS